MAETLQALGFTVSLRIDLDHEAMETSIREFASVLSGVEIALFFYAGHAVQADGHNHLIATDAVLQQKSDLAAHTVRLDTILEAIEGEDRVSLIFLDACRDNPLTRNLPPTSPSLQLPDLGRGLAPIQDRQGTLVAFSTQPNNTASDGLGRNSPFTEAMLRHLPTQGLDIALVMRRIRKAVAASTDRRQIPWDHSSLTDDVVLAPPSSLAPTRPSPHVPILTGHLTAENFGFFEEFVIENLDRVVGLDMWVDQADDEARLQAHAEADDKLFIFYLRPEPQTQISVLEGHNFRHGSYIFDGFFVVKASGTYQGVLTYFLKSTDEAQVRLSNIPTVITELK